MGEATSRFRTGDRRRLASQGEGARALDRDRFETAAKRHEENALPWEKAADELFQDAVENFKLSRKSGYKPSELPEHIRQEMEPEELQW